MPLVTTYCAPCIADLALVRDAVTSVAGTAACMAHAVLLTHGTDDPARRRQRLDALRELASGKAEHADPVEQARLELLVQEYGLAGAMDMGGPSRRQQGQQRPARQGGQHREGQHRDGPHREGLHREGPHREGQPRDGQPRDGQPRDTLGPGGGSAGDEARRPKSRRGRPRPGDRPEGSDGGRPDGSRSGAADAGSGRR